MNIFKRISKALSDNSPSIENNDLPAIRGRDDIIESLLIPEPTKSLLWVTHDDISKIGRAGSLNIVINSDGTSYKKENDFNSEPSLIWTNLPIKKNNDLIQEAMYWPSYSSFNPEARYQYLGWLRDITQPTNLSYVFLYFYGLERHLLVGNYDDAVDEIARLLKAHPKKSFISYASQSLIVASLEKKRFDIIDRVPSLMEEEIDEALALRVIKGTTMTPDDIISITNKVGFKNKRYMNLYPDAFKKELQGNIDELEKQSGNILSAFKLEDFKREETTVFANLSIPENVRLVKVPVILEDKEFRKVMLALLQTTHDEIKSRIANGTIARRSRVTPKQSAQLINTVPVTNDEVDALLDGLRNDNDNILDLHFAISHRIITHYRKRQADDNYHMAIAYCRAQIKIQADAARQFMKEYSDSSLPTHMGYGQLVIILEKENKFNEAMKLAKEAKINRWNGEWDKRIERLLVKISSKTD